MANAQGAPPLQVWDLKAGQLLRTQTVHRGMVTCLAYATSAKLLFSGSIDGSIGVWTDKGNLLQVSRTACRAGGLRKRTPESCSSQCVP